MLQAHADCPCTQCPCLSHAAPDGRGGAVQMLVVVGLLHCSKPQVPLPCINAHALGHAYTHRLWISQAALARGRGGRHRRSGGRWYGGRSGPHADVSWMRLRQRPRLICARTRQRLRMTKPQQRESLLVCGHSGPPALPNSKVGLTPAAVKRTDACVQRLSKDTKRSRGV